MKKMSIILVLFAVAMCLYAAEPLVEYFKANSNGNTITVEWKATNETDISRYEVERSTNGQIFRTMSQFETKGSGYCYKFVDDEIYYKKNIDNTLESKTYTYRIKVIKKNSNYTYTDVIPVTTSVNSVTRRTWGMIKEMFR